MTKLKPCPFCGGKAAFNEIEYPDPNWGMRFVNCTECQACSICMGSDKEDATPHMIEAWNRRAPAGQPKRKVKR